MFPSSSIRNAPTTEPKAPGSTLTIGGFFFFICFRISFFLKNSLMQSKDNKMSNFLWYVRTIFPQALKESLKELKESRSLSSFKLL